MQVSGGAEYLPEDVGRADEASGCFLVIERQALIVGREVSTYREVS